MVTAAVARATIWEGYQQAHALLVMTTLGEQVISSAATPDLLL
jgi:hypothetical protein